MNTKDFIWWLEENSIGGMMTPLIDPVRRYNERGQLTDFNDDIPDLYAVGIRSIISLINAPGEEKIYESAGFEFLCSPIQHFQAPSIDQALELCKFIGKAPKAVLVTCEGGLGKTGTVLACWLIFNGSSPQKAIDKVRSCEAGAIESQQQLQFLFDFADHLAH